MTLIDIQDVRWMVDDKGTWLMVKCQNPTDARAVCDGMDNDKHYTIEIKPKRKKRSLDANGYLWVLCTEISKVLGGYISKEDIYRKHVKNAGQCDFVAIADKAVESLMQAWSTHGIGWFAEKVDYCKLDGCSKVCLYYGSSTYDTAEMSRLIDSVTQDAKAVGVEVLSDAELSLLKEEWK